MRQLSWANSLVPVLSLGLVFAVGCANPDPRDEAAGEKPVAGPKGPEPAKKADMTPAGQTAQKPGDPPPDENNPGGGGGGGDARLGDFAKEQTLKQQEQKELAKHYTQSGKSMYAELRYREAAANFERATKLDPENVEAKQLYERTLWILGDRSKGEFRDVARQLAEERTAKVKQAKVEMDRLYQEGELLKQKTQYDKALERFERVLEAVRWFPYDIGNEGYRQKAEAAIAETKRLQVESEARKRQLIHEAATQEAMRNKAEAQKYLDQALKQLSRDAREAYAARKFERCMRVCDEILAKRPDAEAQKLKEEAQEQHQRDQQLRNFRERVEHLRRQAQWVHASAIPYQSIFEFPKREEWAEISRRDVPLQAKFETSQSDAVMEINRRLDAQKITLQFDQTPFDEAINFLRDITGLNYVISAGAQEKIDAEQLKVSLRLRDITLRNALTFILAVNEELISVIKNDMILITTKGSEQKALFLDFYDVSDIINKTPDFPAPELGLPSKGGGGGKGGGLSGGVLSFDNEKKGNVGTGVDADKLVALVENKLGQSDDGGSVEFSGGVLIVRKTSEAHQKIIQLLEALRRTVGVMVTLEARFIDIQDNFLEQIGVDLINQPKNPAIPAGQPNPPDGFGQIDRPRSTSGGPSDVQVGFNHINGAGDNNSKAAILNLLSQPIGNGSSNPFNIVPTGGLGLQWNYINNFQMQAIIEAIKKKQKARQINAPRITVFNGQRSHVMAIRQRAYIEGVEVNQTGVIPVLNPVIGILNTGSILEVQPTVSHDRRYVTLEVKPTLATEGTPRIPAPVTLAQGFTSIPIELPIITVQKIRSTVTIPDGGTVLIGGLKNYEERESESGVPFAMKVPLLKNLFRRHGFSQLRRSLVVLIKANITVIREEEAARFGKKPQ